jgi:hypothetical protein
MNQEKNNKNQTAGQPTDAETAETVLHTPGPWRLAVLKGDEYSSVVARINERENYTIARPGHPVKAVHEANARLIAAAPELLTAVRELLNRLDELDPQKHNSDLRQFARAAITKAQKEPTP